jgi:hypothetical protein
MFDTKLFEFADFDCAKDYIMARESLPEEELFDFIQNNNLRIDNVVLNPRTNQIRFMFLPSKATKKLTKVFNIDLPSPNFLRNFWELGIPSLQRVIAKYIIQSDMRHQYDNLDETDKTWMSAVILGAKEE